MLTSIPEIGANLAFKVGSVVPEVLRPHEAGFRRIVFEGKLMLER